MGCVASKLDINDVHPNMFAVNNVDDMGSKLSPGQLEITETDLVLHQKGKQPIKWPLKYLKRYGADAGLFSFEAGRKNPTGPGIYAFKCRRAENLFNLLQVRVRSQGPASGSITGGSLPLSSPPGDSSSPPPTPLWLDSAGYPPTNTQYGQISLTDNTVLPTNNNRGDGGANNQGSYINCTLPTQPGSPPRVPPLHAADPTTTTPGYMNITQERPNTVNRTTPHLPPLLSLPAADTRHEYENIGPHTPVLQSPGFTTLPPKPSFLQQATTTSETEPQQHQSQPMSPCITENTINYIVLDLDSAATQEAKQTSPTLKKSSEEPGSTGGVPGGGGYVTIDFDKTDALIKSANQRFFEADEPGIRKTRHNSSLSELGGGKMTHN